MFTLEESLAFVVEAHFGQFRKAKGLPIPYSMHPIEVAKLLYDWGIKDEVVIRAAYGHDLLEDTKYRYDDLVTVLGIEPAEIIEELTFRMPENAKRSKKAEKEMYMETFATKSIKALVIKIADRLCNIRDFIYAEDDYAAEYCKQADALFGILLHRRTEVEEAFGFKVYTKIQASVTQIKGYFNSYQMV